MEKGPENSLDFWLLSTHSGLTLAMETLIEGADTDSLLSGIEARKQRTIQKLQQKYWDHYDGLTSAELRTADRNLYEAMRRRGLLPDLQPRPRVTERQRRKELRSMYKQMCGQAHRRLTRSELRQVDPNLYKQLHRHNLLHLVPSGERPESPQRE